MHCGWLNCTQIELHHMKVQMQMHQRCTENRLWGDPPPQVVRDALWPHLTQITTWVGIHNPMQMFQTRKESAALPHLTPKISGHTMPLSHLRLTLLWCLYHLEYILPVDYCLYNHLGLVHPRLPHCCLLKSSWLALTYLTKEKFSRRFIKYFTFTPVLSLKIQTLLQCASYVIAFFFPKQ